MLGRDRRPRNIWPMMPSQIAPRHVPPEAVASYVRYIRQRQGVHPRGAAREQAQIQCLTEWAPRLTLRDRISRANALGLVTRPGNLWTETTMQRKLHARGLPAHQDPPGGIQAPVWPVHGLDRAHVTCRGA